MAKLPWHGPLFAVQGHLAQRYADALHHVAGLDCPLSSFTVDRGGWSPELAAHLGDDYLGGESLRHAIILSPDQGKAPHLRRRFSYEIPLLEAVYLSARDTLLSLVHTEPVLIEIDNGLTFCRNAVDVASITLAHVRLDTANATLDKSRKLLGLADGLRNQARLLDDGYISTMLDMAQAVGDPRRRTFPPDIAAPQSSLWSLVDSAVYVLRGNTSKLNETVVAATRPEGLGGMPVIPMALDDVLLVDMLHEVGMLRYANQQAQIRRRLAQLEVEALLVAGEQRPATGDLARRRQIQRLSNANSALSSLYWELNGLQQKLAAGAAFEPQTMSPAARWAMSVPAAAPGVIGHLLARFNRYDYQLLALHHPELIEKEWPRYAPAKQRYLAAKFPYLESGFVSAVSAPTAPAS